MKKAKFYKYSKKLFNSVMLENYLFDKNEEFLSKLLEIIRLFYRENVTILCRFFADDKDMFSNKMKEKFSNDITILFTRRKIFSKALYYRMQVTLSEESLNEVVALAMMYCASPEIEVSDRKGVILLELGLNDNDGTFINFNTNEFVFSEIKERINQILNKSNNYQ